MLARFFSALSREAEAIGPKVIELLKSTPQIVTNTENAGVLRAEVAGKKVDIKVNPDFPLTDLYAVYDAATGDSIGTFNDFHPETSLPEAGGPSMK